MEYFFIAAVIKEYREQRFGDFETVVLIVVCEVAFF